MFTKKIVAPSAVLMAAATIAGIGLGAEVARAQQAQLVSEQSYQPQPSRKIGDLEILQMRANFYMIVGAGANVAVQTGPDGAIVVDAGSEAKVDQLIAAIKTISPQPIRFIIDTSALADHVGGNEKLAKAGRTIFNLNNPNNVVLTNGGAAGIIAFEDVLKRMSQPKGPDAWPPAAWPTDGFHEKMKHMYFNGDGMEVLHQPNAVTDGDSFVLFRHSDVVVAGDILDMQHFPKIDLAKGGGIQGELDALNRLMDLAIPSTPIDWRDDGTLVIPAYGRVADNYDIVLYRDMMTIIRDRILDLVKQGKTLEQVKEASPTAGFKNRFGSDSGPWTTNMFVEAVYKSLVQDQEKKKK